MDRTYESGRKQTRFPNVVVAVHKLTGNQYGRVMEIDNNTVAVRTVPSGFGNYHCHARDVIEILRPDLVQPFHSADSVLKAEYERKVRELGLPSNYPEIPKFRKYFSQSVQLRHITRQQCDQFIKGYVPVKAFIDYDSFLDDLLTFVNRSNA